MSLSHVFKGTEGLKKILFCSALALVIAISFLFAGTDVTAADSKEAPMLSKLVAEKKLPPLTDRLPKNPLVVPVVEKIGQYGGDWRTALRGAAQTPYLRTSIGYDPLVRWDPEWTKVIPNVAESWVVSPDAKEYTFRLREGMKWSDGHPFTADDILFWWENVASNPKLPRAPYYIRIGGKTVVEKVDNYTIKFKFTNPNGLFLEHLAGAEGDTILLYPAHYMKQFHIQYNPSGIEKLVKEAGASDWVGLFEMKGDVWQNPEKPTLFGWKATSPLGKATTQFVAVRNPYYWKVDPAGNQLPYLDRVVYFVYKDLEVLVLKIINGEIDMHGRDVNSHQNKAVFTDNMKRGNYRFAELNNSEANMAAISLNLTHKDPVKREIFRNKNFRIGLSHAINRKEIIDLVFVGQGEPHQVAPRPGSLFYNERLAKQYTEYNVKLANEYLDKAGYTKRDAEGFRLGPDGKRISFGVVTRQDKPHFPDIMEIVERNWKAVGIEGKNRVVERALQRNLRSNNQHDALIDDGEAGLRDIILRPVFQVPIDLDTAYGIAWVNWYLDTKGEKEEPPPSIKKALSIYQQVLGTPDPEKQKALMKEIMVIAADDFYPIGICTTSSMYAIVKNNFRNVPKHWYRSWTYANPGPINICQFFVEGTK